MHILGLSFFQRLSHNKTESAMYSLVGTKTLELISVSILVTSKYKIGNLRLSSLFTDVLAMTTYCLTLSCGLT